MFHGSGEGQAQQRKRLDNHVIVKPFLQSGWLDSNQRPHAPQTCTLKPSTPLALNTLAFYLTRRLTSRLIRQSKVKHQWTIGDKQSSFAYQQSKEKAAFSRLSSHPLWIRCNPTTNISLLFSCIYLRFSCSCFGPTFSKGLIISPFIKVGPNNYCVIID